MHSGEWVQVALPEAFEAPEQSLSWQLFLFCFLYLFIYGCMWSSLLCSGFLQLRRAGATLRQSMGFSLRWLLISQLTSPRERAQQLWHTSFVALEACGNLPGAGIEPVFLHWQVILNHWSPVKSVSCRLLKVISHGLFSGRIILQVRWLYCDSVVCIRWDEINE